MKPQFYEKEMLEATAREIISKYSAALISSPVAIPVESIMEKIYGLKLDYQYIRKNGRILGETVFEDMNVPIYEQEQHRGYKLIPVTAGTVLLDMSLINGKNSGRLRYTCAHELAHWVIHNKIFTQSGQMAAQTIAKRSTEADKAIEWQADYLGGCVLMPKCTLKRAFYNNIRGGNVVDTLAAIYDVSHKAMEIRLREICLLQ